TVIEAAEVPVYLTELERRVVHLRDAEGMKWAEIGRQLGMDRRNAQKAHQRAHSKMAQQGPAPSQERQQELQKACEGALEKVRGKIDDKMLSEAAAEVAWQAIWQIRNDPVLWSRASIKELSTVYGQMIDKRQLLRGEPTQITKIQDIRELDEMAKLLHEEMEKRGLLIDVTPEKVG
ncbi:MAG: sigma factor-like helix-turn-helix DNA-binding protein, partial [Alphaproteobacteria bacterium]|nr:sigma factor-like helix-turn-helix DNA-binding protein [Alphaproteobacteria bacterium]